MVRKRPTATAAPESAAASPRPPAEARRPARGSGSAVRRFITTFVFTAIGALSSSSFLWWYFGSSNQYLTSSGVVGVDGLTNAQRGWRLAGSVKRVELKPGAEFDAARVVKKYNEPVIFTRSPVDEWPARDLWTAEYFRANGGTFRDVYYRNTETNNTVPPPDGVTVSSAPSQRTGSGRVFGPIFYHTQPMNELPSVRWRNPYRKVNLSAPAFVDKIERNSEKHLRLKASALAARAAGGSTLDVFNAAAAALGSTTDDIDRGEFLYYVAHVEELAARKLSRAEAAASADSQPAPSLSDDNGVIAAITPLYPFLLTPEQSQVNVWIGQAGVYAHLHYDSYFNFNAQIAGTKRFYLFPPSNASAAYMHPFTHPSHAQSHIDLLTPPTAAHRTEFPRLSELTGFDASLSPGDLLYVPPLWFHAVEALSLSISVNMWSISTESTVVEQVMEIVRKAVIKSTRLHTPSENRRATAAYIIEQTITRLNRRSPLILPPPTTPTTTAGVAFVRSLVDSRFRRLITLGDVSGALPAGMTRATFCTTTETAFTDAERSELVTATLDPAIDRMVSLFMKVVSGNREIWLGNFVENIAFWGADVHTLASFLVNCF